ncbi:MAG TPA: DUF523 domain-containing protein [bacterium]
MTAKSIGHRPVVCVSKCLGFAPCRYNGSIVRDGFVRKLKKRVKFITCCPEVEISLGVPRDPIRIVSVKGGYRLVQPATGLDVTKRMEKKCREILGALPVVDGFILKSRSPSCGLRDVKIYATPDSAVPAGKGTGFFARAVVKRFPELPIEDENRLKIYRCRERFLTKLFGAKER